MMWNRDLRKEEGDEECMLIVVLNSFYNDIYVQCRDWILMNWIAGLSKGIERSLLAAVSICRKDASPARSIVRRLGVIEGRSIEINEGSMRMISK